MSLQPLSNYLRTFRKRSGLSQDELAALLGCKHGSMVSRYERGDRAPSLETLIAYEVIFQSSARELFRGVHDRVRGSVRQRAQRLSRTVDSQPLTPVTKRKMDFLTGVIYESSSSRS